CLLSSSSRIGNHPFDTYGHFSLRSNFHWDLECGTTNSTTLHLYGWSNIVKRFFPNLKTVLTYFLFYFCNCVVEDLVSNTLLPIYHQTVYKLGHQSIVELWIRKNICLFWFRFSHFLK